MIPNLDILLVRQNLVSICLIDISLSRPETVLYMAGLVGDVLCGYVIDLSIATSVSVCNWLTLTLSLLLSINLSSGVIIIINN